MDREAYRQRSSSSTKGRRHGQDWLRKREALFLQDRGFPGRETHAGCDRRRVGRDPLGERAPWTCAAQRRGRRRQPSCAGRDRATALGVLCRTAEGVCRGAGFCRDGVSTQGVERAAHDPVRRNPVVPADRNADWPSRRRPRRWRGKRQEPRVDHRALPSRRRHQRQTHRVCRRARRQGVSARPRSNEADDAPGCARRGGLVVARNQARRNRQAIPPRSGRREVRRQPASPSRARS